ncbi:MAG: PDZ domain-containing protein [Ruminococcaceae bacterium]|nr:PDZ domain-containing protein [Oscillospiraceae bacterium]
MQTNPIKTRMAIKAKGLRIACLLSALMIIFSVPVSAAGPENELTLIPGGMTFGAKLAYPAVMITELDLDPECPAAAAGLAVGDMIISVNGIKTTDPVQLTETVEKAGGEPLTVEFERDGKRQSTTIVPRSVNGKYRIGITVRNSSAGIGTVTFITSNGEFGGLGHGICCKENGKLAPLTDGYVCGVDIKGIKKGNAGEPGEIRGTFCNARLGRISANTACGVFGLYAVAPESPREPMPVAALQDVKVGSATVISTLGDDGPKEYGIEITTVFEPRGGSEKGFAIKVTDPALLERTGGIVQGMSGSPIIQDGKLVGAVTHVMINDPTCGYGIFITTMLEKMPELLKP